MGQKAASYKRTPLKNSKILHDYLIDEVVQGKFVNPNQVNFC
ncbi:MAG: hypothetical protein RLZZ143_886 [Cyanobacteriota bacterium]|jgi:hypothetical protein